MGGTTCELDDTKAEILIFVERSKEGERLEEKKYEKKLQDKKIQRNIKEKEAQQKKQENTEGKKKVSAKWVSDCYFFVQEMNIEDYLIDQEELN